jgi:hypothetical protein
MDGVYGLDDARAVCANIIACQRLRVCVPGAAITADHWRQGMF